MSLTDLLIKKEAVVYSFDVFDTVITRITGDPRGIFCLMGERLKGDSRFPSRLVEDFASHRVAAEHRSRRATEAEEVTLDAIYDSLSDTFPLAPELRQCLIQLEIDVEVASSRGVPGIIDAIKGLRAKGKRIVFTSDIYLPKDTLRLLLAKAGAFHDGDGLYVSSETRLSKASGSLFRHMIETEQCTPQKILHIGDNPHSDIASPRRLGINVLHAADAVLTRYENTLSNKTSERRTSSELPWHLLAGASRLARVAGTGEQLALRSLGADVVGPLLLGYVYWVLRRARSLGLDRLYFVARDGQILCAVANEILKRTNAFRIKPHYLYGSRQAWHLPAIQEIGERELEWLLEADPVITLRILAKRGGIETEEVQRTIAKNTGETWEADTPLTRGRIQRMRSLIISTDIKQHILSAGQQKRSVALDYFKQEGLCGGERFGLVDLGWVGRIQDSLKRILELGSFPVSAHGFYFGLVRMTRDTGTGNEKHTYFFSPGSSAEFLTTGKRFANLLEIFTAADHGTTESYFRDPQGTVVPRLKSPTNKEALEWGLDSLRSGIMDFIGGLPAGVFDLLEREEDAYRDAMLSNVALLLDSPSLAESEAVGDYRFSSDQAGLNLRAFAPPFDARAALEYGLANWNGKVYSSYWLAASRSRSGLLPRLLLSPALQGLLSLVSRPYHKALSFLRS